MHKIIIGDEMLFVCSYCHEYRSDGETCAMCGCEMFEAATREDEEVNGRKQEYQLYEWIFGESQEK